MSVRKRVWTTRKGETKEAWIVDYTVNGSRHIETFDRKKDADARKAQVTVDVGKGTHIAPNKTPTVAEAGEQWIRACEADGLERATVEAYRQHLRLHIVPYLGPLRLAQLTVPLVRKFKDDLRAHKRSPAMAKRIVGSLGSLLGDAQERGLVAQNVVRGLKREKRGKRSERRGKLKVGGDVPTPHEISAIIAHLEGRWRPLLLTAIFAGLRASELRGLKWSDVDLPHATLHVRQRADRYQTIGKPKSESGERVVPLTPLVVNTLREWKLQCPKSEHHLVFPTGAGEIEYHSNIVHRGLGPAQVKAGVKTKDGKPKYPGLHALRHFYASWCISRRKDGGLELPIKVVQERLGHSTITMTADIYGHLFPSADDGSELAEAEKRLLSLSAT
jgi:integrase